MTNLTTEQTDKTVYTTETEIIKKMKKITMREPKKVNIKRLVALAKKIRESENKYEN